MFVLIMVESQMMTIIVICFMFTNCLMWKRKKVRGKDSYITQLQPLWACIAAAHGVQSVAAFFNTVKHFISLKTLFLALKNFFAWFLLQMCSSR